MRPLDDQQSEKDETLTIPAKHFVCSVDLDCEEPFCIVAPDYEIWDNGDKEEKRILIPKPLAYYLSTHFCGSKKMYDNIFNNGAESVKRGIKEILDLEKNNE
ncbi:MAG TPA: hypothetical protein VMZ91_01255 [Candidatus Paceibacterota bacterium]|nr:hypothetical protein [Candidatus Paceibacterota bacterium]